MILPGKFISNIFDFDIEIIFDNPSKGQINMDIDWERTIANNNGYAIPMLRFYGWKPFAISLGANQKETDFDLEKCKRKGFDLVRRPTGGRAVLHSKELTYSFVIPINGKYNPKDAYREIHIFLLRGLQQLGVKDLYFEKSQVNLNEFYHREIASVSCFATSARYEIEWDGKKIVGSAQRVFGNTLLQHGSILLWKGYEQLAEVVKVSSEDLRNHLRKYIKKHSISVGEILGREITFEEATNVFKEILNFK